MSAGVCRCFRAQSVLIQNPMPQAVSERRDWAFWVFCSSLFTSYFLLFFVSCECLWDEQVDMCVCVCVFAVLLFPCVTVHLFIMFVSMLQYLCSDSISIEAGEPAELHWSFSVLCRAPDPTQSLLLPLNIIEVLPLCPAPTRNIGCWWKVTGSDLNSFFFFFFNSAIPANLD